MRYAWKWWVGSDEERFHTECATRAEAVQIAEEDGGWITEACKTNIRLASFFDAADFLERADEAAYDDYGDPEGGDPVFDMAPKYVTMLQDAVRHAIEMWQANNGLVFKGYQFAKSRNLEYVPAKETEE